MASEESLEHSLLDVITVSRPLKVRPARAAFHIALRRFEKVRLAKRPLANLTFSNRANSPPRLEVKLLDVMASEASLEHSLLDVMPSEARLEHSFLGLVRCRSPPKFFSSM